MGGSAEIRGMEIVLGKPSSPVDSGSWLTSLKGREKVAVGRREESQSACLGMAQRASGDGKAED